MSKDNRRYRDVVTVERKTSTVNAYGDVVDSWVELITTAARFHFENTNTSNEGYFDDLQEQVRRKVKVEIRKPYAFTINELDRFFFQGIVYDINKVEVVGNIAPYKLILFAVSVQTPLVEPYRPGLAGTLLTIDEFVLTIDEFILILEP